jgi:hypothetical protein
VSRYGLPDRELGQDLARIAFRAVNESSDERALIIGKTGGVRQVLTVVHKHEMDNGQHLSRWEQMRSKKDVDALLHIWQRPGERSINVLVHANDLYRIRVRLEPPRGASWCPVSKESAARFKGVWGDLNKKAGETKNSRN